VFEYSFLRVELSRHKWCRGGWPGACRPVGCRSGLDLLSWIFVPPKITCTRRFCLEAEINPHRARYQKHSDLIIIRTDWNKTNFIIVASAKAEFCINGLYIEIKDHRDISNQNPIVHDSQNLNAFPIPIKIIERATPKARFNICFLLVKSTPQLVKS
jgi:hypothetical protein